MQNDDHKTEGQAAVRCSVLLGHSVTSFDMDQAGKWLILQKLIWSARLNNERHQAGKLHHPLFTFTAGKFVVRLDKLISENLASWRPKHTDLSGGVVPNVAAHKSKLNKCVRHLSAFYDVLIFGFHKMIWRSKWPNSYVTFKNDGILATMMGA